MRCGAKNKTSGRTGTRCHGKREPAKFGFPLFITGVPIGTRLLEVARDHHEVLAGEGARIWMGKSLPYGFMQFMLKS